MIYPWKPKFCSICKRSGHEASARGDYKNEWKHVPPTTRVGAAGVDPAITKSGDAKWNEDEVTKKGEEEVAKQGEEVLKEVHKESTDKAGSATTTHSLSKGQAVQKEKPTTPLSVDSTNTPTTNSHSLNKGKPVQRKILMLIHSLCYLIVLMRMTRRMPLLRGLESIHQRWLKPWSRLMLRRQKSLVPELSPNKF